MSIFTGERAQLLNSFFQTNVRVTEEIRYPNLNTNKRTNERILKRHQRQKEIEKSRFPNRFEIVPTLAELCSKHLKSKL